MSRYVGGTLLGVSGLIIAYRTAAAAAIQNAEIKDRTVQEIYEISFPYNSMNDVMKVLKEGNAGQSEQKFDIDCRIMISFRSSATEKILSRLSRINGLIYNHIQTI
jgi:putative IMPACT (imprinted ancient) family translation regulator